MVTVCPDNFDFKNCDNINEETRKYCQSQFQKYPFELDHFQKYAIVGIETEKHILVTAHTGSGKTLPAEYAINKYCKEGKKVIYTGPIKSLSNQKYHEFTKKFPNISFGIMTGDIKFNPEADCLIMTTEILRNALYNRKKSTSKTNNSNNSNDTKTDDITRKTNTILQNSLDFNLDIENEVACVIFDEVHYINDQDRGKVWEECIMNMPPQIQMVLLSATIDREVQFAKWIETIKKRDVWIASTHKRVVPLTHYLYYLTNSQMDNKISSSTKSNTTTDIKAIKQYAFNYTDTLLPIKSSNEDTISNIGLTNYDAINKLSIYAAKNNIRIHNKHVINNVISKLHNERMLPAICFVFSRKQVERYAKYIEQNLFEIYDQENGEINHEEHKKTNLVEKECKKILMKFPNYKEYIELPEYMAIVNLLKKGVAIHHSGLLPVLREMIELMFDRGFVKLLFATETFSVGINMPTKTVLFTNLSKYSNTGFRYVLPHEYTQMAGRAGRRGLDKVGNVIHLNNLFEVPDLYNYKNILSGTPQRLTSKFKTDPQLILKLFDITNVDNHDNHTSNNITPETIIKSTIVQSSKDEEINDELRINIISYLNSSMDQEQKNAQLVNLYSKINELNETIDKNHKSLNAQNVNINSINTYVTKTEQLPYLKSKKRKQTERELNKIKQDSGRNFERHVDMYNQILDSEKQINEYNNIINEFEQYSSIQYKKMYEILQSHKFICSDKLTILGKIASCVNEINNIVIAEVINNNMFDSFDVFDLITYISLFVHVRVNEEHKQYKFDQYNLMLQKNTNIDNIVNSSNKLMEYYYNLFTKHEIECTNDDYELCYDVYDLVNEWCYVENECDAKLVIQKCHNRDIFIGEFVKCLLKIVNITNELNSVAIKTCNVKLEFITSQVEEKLLKYVATNQSLYV